MKPKRFRNFVSRSLPTTAFLAMSAAVVSTAFSANVIWDGGPAGTGTDLGLAANWAGDVVPSTATPDTAVWDGTVAGPLALVYTTTTIGGAPGNPGIGLSVAATQTSSLTLDSGLNTSALRVNAVTIADGAGPVTIGDGNDIFNLTIGGTAGTTQVWTNNSLTNAATVRSDVRYGLGGSGDHTIHFTGPGDWDVAAPISPSNGAQLSLFKTGTGELTLSGGGNLNNNALAILGAAQCAALKEGTTRITSGAYTCNTKEFTVGGFDAGAGTDTQLIMDGGSITGVSWLSIGKGNGDGTASSDVILNNAASITSTNISLGWFQTNPVGPKASITLNDTSSITTNGTNNIGESTGANVTMTLNDSSSFNTTNNTVEIAQNSATATVNLNGTSTFSSNLTRIGRGNNNAATAKGYVNVDGGTLNSEGDLVLSYAGSATSLGRLTIDSGTVNVATTTKRWMILHQFDFGNAEVVMSGGNLNLNTNTDIRFNTGGTTSTGTNVFTMNGGSVTSFTDNKTTPLGGGVLDLNQSGGAGANNTFHLNGGTLTIRAVNTSNNDATAAFNFNGGLLKATGNDANFVNLGGATQTV
ncbi:MAG: hypothetical protein KDN05_13165, partial [Verrucomicrobiae bacterium]|nr:hypothetical protein [Verrucomicrobiae bacterium]